MKLTVIIVIVLSLVLGALFYAYNNKPPQETPDKNKPITLTYWGLNEDEKIMQPLIKVYQEANPNITINFVRQSPLNYRTRLQTQVQSGQGPDIFSIHSSWVGMLEKELATAPESVFPPSEFARDYYPIVKDSFALKGGIKAVPLEIGGLGLYVNTDILRGASVGLPNNWQELIDGAKKAMVRDSQGQLQTAGVAMGTTSNIDFWPEIIETLFLQQPNADLTKPGNSAGAEVLKFYTKFVVDPKDKTWDSNLPNSTKMFTGGRLAFYFAPTPLADEIKDANPGLNFKVIPVPQLPSKSAVAGGFWAKAVSQKSTNQKPAWEFVKFLASKEALTEIYNQEIAQSKQGKPFPRVEMQNLQINDPVLGAFALQGPYYKSWYLNSTTSDAGINDEMISLYGQAIDKILKGGDVEYSLKALEPGIVDTLKKYNSDAN